MYDGTRQTATRPATTKTFQIQMFGINEIGETCSIIVTDFKPFMYVLVPSTWREETLHEWKDHIKTQLNAWNFKGILSMEFENHKKLYGFSPENMPSELFVRIEFANLDSHKKFAGLWSSYNQVTGNREKKIQKFKNSNLELYESFIPPLLRYFHIHEISPSGWIRINVTRSTQLDAFSKTTTCTYEYICSQKEIEPQLTKETLVPYKICSFDLEASSSHGDFPLPTKTYKRLATQIAEILKKQGMLYVEEILRRAIFTAFGHDCLNTVDRVFIKGAASELTLEEVTLLYKNFMACSLGNLTLSERVKEKLSMDSYFQTTMNEITKPSEDNPDDGGDESKPVATYPQKKDKPVVKAKKPVTTTATVVDYLTNSTDINDQIDKLNMLLCQVFPPVKGDEITFVGSTFSSYGQDSPYLQHCIVLEGNCDPVENAVIQYADTEKDLLLQWSALIQKENPDILIGYNIFGFDYTFMFERAKENDCLEEFLKLSRNVDHVSANVRRGATPEENVGDYVLDNMKIQLASGEYNLYYPCIQGRCQIDLLTYVRKEFTTLASYKLDDVAGNFINDSIRRVENDETHTLLYTKNTTGLHVHDYIHIQKVDFTNENILDGAKFYVVGVERIDEKTVVVRLEKMNIDWWDSSKKYQWGLAKDNVSVQDIFRFTRGTSQERSSVAKYCIQDCNILHHLMKKLDIMVGFIEMARLCSVPISYLVLRGQGIKLTSFVAKECRKKNTLMPDLDRQSDAVDGYEGAVVLSPQCGIYLNEPIACLDYSSLYPSNMISQNFSHDSKVGTKEFDLAGNLIRETGDPRYQNLEGYTYVDVEFDTYQWIRPKPTAKAKKVKSGIKVCRWAKFPDGKRGILPSILEELLKARKTTRKLLELEPDAFMKNILDKRQQAYKVTANSVYGQCGSKTSTFFEKDVAASTTAIGRLMITYAKKVIEQVFRETLCQTTKGPVITHSKCIYGDTDSVFFSLGLHDAITRAPIRGVDALVLTIELAGEISKLCSQFLIPPMNLTYEKTMDPFIILAKKRYVGVLYETDPTESKLKVMGLTLKSRASCDYLKDIYGHILTLLIYGKGNSIAEVIQFIEFSLQQLIDGQVPMDKLVMTRSLKSNYAQAPGHKVLADRIGERQPGSQPKSGDRISYIFIEQSNPKALMGDKIETPEFIREQSLKIDYAHYIQSQILIPLQQLLGLALEDIWNYKRKPLAVIQYKKDMAKLAELHQDEAELLKKQQALMSKHVSKIIFEPFLNSLNQQKNRLQSLTTFFKNSAKPN
jgi:DNA polymerase elongation subunit (family B)